MTEARSLEIAGLRFALRPEAGWRVLEDDLLYQPFLNTAEPAAQGEVRVRLDFEAPDLGGLPVLFDTADAWCAYRDGQDTLIDMAPGGAPTRLWTARLHADRAQVDVYCGAPLVVCADGGAASHPPEPAARSPGVHPASLAVESGEGQRSLHNPLRYPLDQLLMLELLPALGGLVVHGAGAMRTGVGLAFPGRSGAGKSTLMRLMRGAEGVQRLSDDRVVLRTGAYGTRVFGTPWAGDEQLALNRSAPLGAIVFLHHASEDRLVPIDRRDALRQLLLTVCIPWFDAEGAAQGLAVCGALVGTVPAYELHFRPEPSALSVLEALW